MAAPLIKMEHIVKVFPPSNVALDDVSIEINAGEIHAVIGENGAGKSTLMKVLYALEKPNQGSLFLNGERKTFLSPKDAVANGIGMVHQEFMLIPSYTVMENIILGYEPKNKFGLLDIAASRKKVEAVFQQISVNIDQDERIENLSVAIQQKIEIMKQLYRDAKILIMDEPTAVLAPQEVDELFAMFRKLKAQGTTIIFISHKLDEILEIADSITVMRQGKRIWTKENKNMTKQDLASAMVGRDVVFAAEKPPMTKGEPVLALKNVTVRHPRDHARTLLDGVSLAIAQGEIVGIAGVEGNGQYELVQAVMGLMPVADGSITLNGKEITNEPLRERRRKIAYVPQDRKISGSSQKDTINDNAFMTHHYLNNRLTGPLRLLSNSKIYAFSNSIIEKFGVVATGNRALIGSLSGGNQQKVIVGREFELGNPLVVLDQPVRGLDVGSIEYIQQRIIEQRQKGTAILLVSADLDELFALSDTIVVLYKGKIAAIKNPAETDKAEIGEYMLGAREGDPA